MMAQGREEQNSGQPPTFWQVLGSALAALGGIQSQANRERDCTHGNPKLFAAVGVLLTTLFVLTLVGATKLILWLAIG